MDELIELYIRKFDDVFPMQSLRGYSEKEMMKMIIASLESGNPIIIEYEDNKHS